MARIGTIELQAVLKEEPVFKVTVTKHPVERGARITDHAHPELISLNVEAIVSELVGGDPEAAHAFFESKHGKPEPMAVVLPRGIYPLMVMEEYAPLFESVTGLSLRARFKFVEWRTVNTALAAVQRQRAQVKKGAAKQEPAKPAKFVETGLRSLVGQGIRDLSEAARNRVRPPGVP